MPPDENLIKSILYFNNRKITRALAYGSYDKKIGYVRSPEPTPTVSMNPKDIRKLGLKRGKVLVKHKRYNRNSFERRQ